MVEEIKVAPNYKCLDHYLEDEHQWRRDERIIHAQYRRRIATTPRERTFWRLVLRANGFFDPPWGTE